MIEPTSISIFSSFIWWLMALASQAFTHSMHSEHPPHWRQSLRLLDGLFSRKAGIDRPDHVRRGLSLFPFGIGKVRPQE